MLLILFSVVLGILFQITYGMPAWFWAMVLLGNLVGWYYSAPPLRLATRGLGELAMIFNIGVLIPGLAYLAASGKFFQDALLFTFPLMCYGLAFILAVEIPDMEADRLGKKNNWVARWGRSFGFSAIGATLLLATLFFLNLPWLSSRVYPVDLHLLGILSLLPLGAGWIGLVRLPSERDRATRVAFLIMVSLAIFCMMSDGYLIFLAARQMG
jgi:1,4-dihydroxy-2-naphthoate octaprenyltransferase